MESPRINELGGGLETGSKKLLASLLIEIGGKKEQDVLIGAKYGQRLSQKMREERGGLDLSVTELPGAIFKATYQAGAGFVPYRLFEGGVVLRGYRCPFGGAVIGNVKACEACEGIITGLVKDNTGYARTHVAKSHARGFNHCLMVCYWQKKAGR